MKFACNDNYTLEGNRQIKCEETKDWSGALPYCRGNNIYIIIPLISFSFFFVRTCFFLLLLFFFFMFNVFLLIVRFFQYVTIKLQNSFIWTSTSLCPRDFDIFLLMSPNFRVNLEFLWPKKNSLSWQIQSSLRLIHCIILKFQDKPILRTSQKSVLQHSLFWRYAIFSN